MKKIFLVALLLGIQFNSISCTAESISDSIPETFLQAKRILDIPYGDHPKQLYDIYLPANRTATKTKVIALIHGGRYTKGDKKQMRSFVNYFQHYNPDYAIVNLNYVLADSVTPAFPHQFLNVGQVLEKVVQAKDELQILPEFALVGVSSGAHIAMMYDYYYDTQDRVKMVTNIVGPSDFTDPFFLKSRSTQALLDLLIDKDAYPPDTDYLKIISPAHQVTSKSSPTILFYGRNDPTVPYSNAITLNEALKKAGVDQHLYSYDGEHFNWEPADIEDVKNKISIHVEQYLPIEN